MFIPNPDSAACFCAQRSGRLLLYGLSLVQNYGLEIVCLC